MIKLLHIAPFLRILLFILFGFIIQIYWNIFPFIFLFVTIGIILLLFSYIPKFNKFYSLQHLFGLGTLLLLFSLGSFLSNQINEATEWDPSDNIKLYEILIIDDPIQKPKTIQCKARILNTQPGNKLALNKKIIVYIPKENTSLNLSSGDYLTISAKLEQSPLYLRKQSFAAKGFVKKGNWMKTKKENPKASLHQKTLVVRKKVLMQLKQSITEPSHFSIASALLLGYRHDMDKELRVSFANIGAGHVLAISGLHFSILFGMVYFSLSFIGNSFKGRIIQYIILLPLIWGFALLVNLTPSVIRAALMLSIAGIGKVFFIRPYSLNTLSASAFLMLLFDPFFLYNIGFQLSFLAVFFILLLNPYLNKLYTSQNKIIKYLWDLITISISAQIGVLPLSIYYFNQFPIIFLITNLCIIPIITILLFLIPFSLLLSLIFEGNYYIFYPLNKSLDILLYSIKLLDSLSWGNIQKLHLNFMDLIIMYVLIIIICGLIIKKKIIYAYLFIIIVVFRLFYYLC